MREIIFAVDDNTANLTMGGNAPANRYRVPVLSCVNGRYCE